MDAFHGANLDTIAVGGEAMFRAGAGPRAPGAEHLPPLNLARRFFGEDKPFVRYADYIDYVLAVQGDVGALCPPLTIPLGQCHAAFDILEAAFDAVGE